MCHKLERVQQRLRELYLLHSREEEAEGGDLNHCLGLSMLGAEIFSGVDGVVKLQQGKCWWVQGKTVQAEGDVAQGEGPGASVSVCPAPDSVTSPLPPLLVTRAGALSQGWLHFRWDVPIHYEVSLLCYGLLTQPQGTRVTQIPFWLCASAGAVMLITQTPSKAAQGWGRLPLSSATFHPKVSFWCGAFRATR